MGSQSFSLNWNNHKSNMSSSFQQLFSAKAFVDVTIVCDGLSLKAHKMVLSASSPLFRRLLLENPCQHPIVIMTDIGYSDMEALLSFMYRGEIEVTEEKLSHFLRTAEKLKIKGLSSSDSSRTLSKRSNSSKQNNSQSVCHTVEDYLDPVLTESNSTNNADFRVELPAHSSSSLEVNKFQRATPVVKPEASAQKSEYIDSDNSFNNDLCLRNGSSDYSTTVNQLCPTEFAKSTISCLRHWEGLTSGNPTYVENQNNNDNSNVQQEIPSSKESIPMVIDEDHLQDQIFPPPVMQQTAERSIEDINLSKTQQAEEESFEFNKEGGFESSSCNNAEVKQTGDENIGSTENTLPVTEESQNLEINRDVQLVQNNDSKEPREFNPYLTCGICKRGFEDLKRLCLHRRSHNCDQQGPFTCSTCGKIFTLKSRFRCHIRTHSGRRPFRCEVCSRAFMRNEHLKDHMRIHSGEKPFACTICEKKFITKGHLTIHNRSHTGEKPYICDFCPKKFVKSSDLMTHVRGHTGERPYVCGLCGKSYARTSNLKMHASRAHSAEHQPASDHHE